MKYVQFERMLSTALRAEDVPVYVDHESASIRKDNPCRQAARRLDLSKRSPDLHRDHLNTQKHSDTCAYSQHQLHDTVAFRGSEILWGSYQAYGVARVPCKHAASANDAHIHPDCSPP